MHYIEKHIYLQKGKLTMKKNLWLKRIFILLLVTILCLPNTSVQASSITTNNNMKEAASMNAGNVQVQGSNSFGKILQNSLTDYTNQKNQTNNPNCILDIEMSGKTANVSFRTTQSCTLLVGIYSEDGTQLIASGEKEVKESDTNVAVAISTGSIPTYYYIRATLISSELGRPLSEEYTNPMYTKDMQQLMDQTVDDFNEEQVVNLDNDKKNNFVVLDDDVKVIEPEKDHNTVVNPDSESGTYTIKNIDSQISNLKKGDTFSYEYEENEFLIAKVANIDITDSTAVITEDNNVETEDVFSVVKIDTQADSSSATVDTDSADECVTYMGLSENTGEMKTSAFKGDGSIKAPFLKYSFDTSKKNGNSSDSNNSPTSAKVSGSASLALETNIKFYLSLKKQYLQFDVDAKFNLEIQADVASDSKLPLGYVRVIPIAGVTITIEPALDLKITGKIKASFSVKLSFGLKYDSSASKKFQLITPKPTVDLPSLEIEAKVFVGIDLSPSVSIISDKISEAKATGTIGLNISAKKNISAATDTSTQHSCKVCIDGNISVKLALEANLTLLSKLKSAKASADIGFDLTNFYWSVDKGKFGFGSCPYKKYRVKITFKDEAGKLLTKKEFQMSGIKSDNQPDFVTDEKGVYTAYYEAGKYNATFKMDGYSDGSASFTIADAAKDISVTLKKEDTDDNKQTDTPDGIAINATNFPDANFRQFILESIDYDENKYLSASEINDTTTMAITSLNISNLKGIEYFSELTYLDCGDNQLTSLDVSRNTKLSVLACYQNNLASLNVSNNSQLTELDCYENNLTSLNVSSNTNLQQLWCYNNNLSSLDIRSNPNLTDLSCSGNGIKTLDIRNNPNLTLSGCDEDVEIIDANSVSTSKLVKKQTIGKTSTNGSTTATYNNLSPDKKYMFYVFTKNAAYGEKITADKLVYATQITSDAAGNATIEYVSNTNAGTIKLVSEDAVAIADTSIHAQNFIYDGKEKTAVLSLSYGKYILTEGTDFTVSGNTTARNAGTYTVTITGMGEFAGTVNATYKITKPATNAATISSIKITGTTKKVAAGKKTTLSATVLPKDCANKKVNWTSSNTKYATVNKNGIVSTKAAGAGKTVTITAVAADGSGITTTYKLKIVKHAVKKITLNAKKVVNAGKKLTVKATVITTGKTANKELTWTSSNPKFATVTKKGIVTTKKAGAGKTVTITAAATDGSNKKATIKIKIK